MSEDELSGWYRESGERQNDYFYVGNDARLYRDNGEVTLIGRGAHVTVSKGRAPTPNFGVGTNRNAHGDDEKWVYEHPEGSSHGSPTEYGTYTHAAHWTTGADGNSTYSHPSTLFTDHPPTVEWAAANKEHGPKVVTGIGIAANDLGIPIPDSDLSATSSPLVKRATERGYVKPNIENPTAAVTNEIRQEDEPLAIFSLSGQFPADKLQKSEVKAGWSTVRSILGKGRTAPPSDLPLSPIKNDVVRTTIAGGWVHPDNEDEGEEQRKPPVHIPGQEKLF
jgi:hypothetical protein